MNSGAFPVRLRLLVALVFLSSFAVAKADSYLYQFDDTNVDWRFSYLSPSLLTNTFSSFDADTCTIVGEPRSCEVRFEINNGIYGNSVGIRYPYIGLFGEKFFSDLGPGFFDVGTHTSGTTTLAITQVPTVTPEPSSLSLLGTGILGVIGAKRRFA